MDKNRTVRFPQIGIVEDVEIWTMPVHRDIRGRLFKAYTAADRQLFPTSFQTYEHFFTESEKNVFRGMHFQGGKHEVSKIISITQGKAMDFLFDFRENSKTFGFLQVVRLNDSIPTSIYVPPGIAHGYLSLEERTIISYSMNGPFCENCDSGFNGNLIADFLPIMLQNTIRSPKDSKLVEFEKFKFSSKCNS